MSFYNEHLVRIKNPVILSPYRLERGMVVKMRYIPMDSKRAKNYMVFILQPRWPNNTNGLLHALSLNEVNPSDFMKFAEVYPEVLARSVRVRKLEIPKLRLNETSKKFYLKEIKFQDKVNKAYRTFNPKSIRTLSVVNYDYGIHDKID